MHLGNVAAAVRCNPAGGDALDSCDELFGPPYGLGCNFLWCHKLSAHRPATGRPDAAMVKYITPSDGRLSKKVPRFGGSGRGHGVLHRSDADHLLQLRLPVGDAIPGQFADTVDREGLHGEARHDRAGEQSTGECGALEAGATG